MLRRGRAEREVPILHAHLAQVAVSENDNVRKITAWAAIIAVPTMGCT